ncbi:DUF2000 family protein [Agrobacterium vitis]|uniref:DUF2000 family protein n=1 Tax=Agrobacterium vitis TaxID=373 RepID=UPI003D2AB8B8
MQRVAIVVTKALSGGLAANAAAILSGQLAACRQGFFAPSPVVDLDGLPHATVNQNIVLLKASGGQQILNTAKTLCQREDLVVLVFSGEGQATSNDVQAYSGAVASSTAERLGLIAMLIAGPDEQVRQATKKFSIFE